MLIEPHTGAERIVNDRKGRGAVLMSTLQPTGQSIERRDNGEYVRIARDTETAVVMDEFCSHYYCDGKMWFMMENDDGLNWPRRYQAPRTLKT
jgi:aspartate/methionine/tyrosine aminotransferase